MGKDFDKPILCGKWIRKKTSQGVDKFECSVCQQECNVETCMGEPMYSFCPNCGIKMGEEEYFDSEKFVAGLNNWKASVREEAIKGEMDFACAAFIEEFADLLKAIFGAPKEKHLTDNEVQDNENPLHQNRQ